MSQENSEIVRAAFEAWNAGDMETVLVLTAPDVVMRPPEGWPEPGPVVGREAVRRQWEQMRDTFDSDALHPVSDFTAIADHVLVRFIWRGAGRGPQADLEMTAVYTVRKGHILGQDFFWDHAEALEAVGLSEQAMSRDAATVRRAFEVWNESGPAAVIDRFWTDDAVYREGPGWPEPGVYHGRAAALERMQALVELAGPLQVRLDELIELDDGRLIACVRLVGPDAASLAPYTDTFAVVHRLRDGLVVEADYYLDRAAALEAVGLRE